MPGTMLDVENLAVNVDKEKTQTLSKLYKINKVHL